MSDGNDDIYGEVHGDVSAIHMTGVFGYGGREESRSEEPRIFEQPRDYAVEAPAFVYTGRPGRTVMQLREMATTALSKLRRPAKVGGEDFIGDTLMLDQRVA